LNYDYVFKVCIFGEEGVGKTSLIQRLGIFEIDMFYEATFNVDIKKRHFQVANKEVLLKLWDIKKTIKDESFYTSYFRKIDGGIFVFDITNKASLTILGEWLKKFNQKNIPIIVVGNKADLKKQRSISDEEVNKIKDKYSIIKYVETSAKIGENIYTIFEFLIFDLLKNQKVN